LAPLAGEIFGPHRPKTHTGHTPVIIGPSSFLEQRLPLTPAARLLRPFSLPGSPSFCFLLNL
jgi:hypothetical protein